MKENQKNDFSIKAILFQIVLIVLKTLNVVVELLFGGMLKEIVIRIVLEYMFTGFGIIQILNDTLEVTREDYWELGVF